MGAKENEEIALRAVDAWNANDWNLMKDSWSEEHHAIEAVESAGDKVLLQGRWSGGKGEASGLDFDQQICLVHTIQGGRIVRIEYYLDEREARRAAGVQEETAPP